MGTRRVVLVIAVVLALCAHAFGARQIAVGEVHAEADVADEAGAVTLLVHTALAGSDVTLVPVPDGLTLRGADQLAKANISHAVLMELSREGTGLRLTFAIVGSDGARDVGFVRAGDGDVITLAQGVVERAVTTCGLTKREVSPIALGPLHPYAAALRQRATPAAAAAALADALPITTLTVSAAPALLAAVPAKAADAAASTIAARALRDTKRLTELGASTDAAGIGAKALAALGRSNRQEAAAALGAKPPKHGLVTLVQIALAENGSDRALFETRIKEGLIGDQVRPVLAIAAALVGSTLTPGLHKALVTAAEKTRAPGVASRIGLNAAELGVDINRALDLISARELEAYDLKRLETIVAKRTDAVALRLKAELSMRNADGLESAAVAAYLAAAPMDPRAHRYQGWVLANDNKWVEAAAEFAKASAPGEQARALLAGGDPRAALIAVGGSPKSAEELVIVVHVALLDKKVEEAVTQLAVAERMSPVNPVVHKAVIALVAVKPDADRLAVSRTLVEKGTGVVTKVTAVATGSDGSASVEAVDAGEKVTGITKTIDPQLLLPLLQRLSGLIQLQKRTLVLAQMNWEPAFYSFKTIDAEPIRGTIIKILSAPPYRLKVRPEPAKLDGASDTKLAELTADADAVLIFQVSIVGNLPSVELTFYTKDAADKAMTHDTIKAPGVIGFDDGKLKLVLAFVGVLLIGLFVYLFRAKGRIKIKLDKAPDVGDEIVCVEITKSPTRPRVDDPAKFVRETKTAGTITKQHSATLIASGQVFKIGVGHWYVHVYGAFARSGKLLAVPSSCTQEIVVERGQLTELKFELTSKLADVRVEVTANPRRGNAVWVATAEVDKVYTDDDGIALLSLPVGSHMIVIEHKGRKFERQLQITALKQQILTINIERELRLGGGLALDVNEGEKLGELDNAEPAKRPNATKAAAKPGVRLTPRGGLDDALPPSITMPQSATSATSAKVATPAKGAPIANAPTAAMIEPPHRPGMLRDPAKPDLAIDIGGFQLDAPAAPAAPAPNRTQARAHTPRPGDTLLGRYRIDSELGRGAMGVVHRAWDEKLERTVAIKEMADDLRTNPEALRLFTQEAKALAQLNHTNIVGMYDQITDDSGVYMIMEFVDGRPLAELAQEQGPMPWRDAVAILEQVLAGLGYAHARKVIHRDIKPANIFVGSDDRTVKIGDFGLARVMHEVTIRRTEIRGTPLYMAPEQITGTNVDHRADLYATGCMLFELVTGRPPFIDGDILYAQMHLPPPSAGSMAEIPAALDDLINALLNKKADDRPSSATEVSAALKNVR